MFEYEKLNEKIQTTISRVLPKECALGAHYLFFIDTSIDTCQKRIALRGREGEINKVEDVYLRDMREEYFSYVHKFKVESGLNTMRSEGNDDEDSEVLLSSLADFIRDIILKEK